jgi:hypothetical protein
MEVSGQLHFPNCDRNVPSEIDFAMKNMEEKFVQRHRSNYFPLHRNVSFLTLWYACSLLRGNFKRVPFFALGIRECNVIKGVFRLVRLPSSTG